jgi:carboxymethylenebutenolidase
MCDETTETENQSYLTRRGFGVLGVAGAAAMALPGCAAAKPGDSAAKADDSSASKQAAGVATAERAVLVATPDGQADGFFVHPREGRHPAVLMWPDVAGLRDAYKTLGRDLAGAGYAVLVVNPYYRSAAAPVVKTMDEWRTPEGQGKIAPMRDILVADAVDRDATAFVAWLDAQQEVDTARGIGTNGYCMTGPFTIRTAAAAPQRVKAAASFHGGGLVTAEKDSPHLLIPRTRAGYVFAIAQNDDAREPRTKDVLRQTCREAGRSADIEVFPAQHGWCTPDAPVYDPAQQARAWGKMLALFKAL